MRIYSIIALAVLATLLACSPAEVPPIGDPLNRISGLEGSWIIDEVRQVEISAEERGFPDFVTSQDITNAVPGYSFADFRITFSGDQVTTVIGNAPVDIAEGQGTWMATTDASSAVTDGLGLQPAQQLVMEIEGETYELGLGSLANLFDDPPVLVLEQISTDEAGEPMIRYAYRFIKE